ncbi:MAG: A24 family peptidase [Eubacteriales bacterium]|nr:A24 family peptidase [Eubacteriales bacterium]
MKRLWEDKKQVFIILMVVEAAGILMLTKYGYHWLKILRYLLLMGFLVPLAFIDHEKTIIPNKILLVLFGIRVVLLGGEMLMFPDYRKDILLSSGAGLAVGLVIFLLAYVLSRKSIGLGDVKLAGVLGWYLGASLIWFDIVVCLLLSAVFCIIQLARKKLSLKDSIPLAPFFSIGTILILLLGF